MKRCHIPRDFRAPPFESRTRRAGGDGSGRPRRQFLVQCWECNEVSLLELADEETVGRWRCWWMPPAMLLR